MLRLPLLVFSSSLLLVFAACGKKGPPLAPLNLAPEPPQTIVARRLGNTVYLQMKAPAKNFSGRGAFSVDHIDIYAVTLAPGSVYPPNRDLLKPEYVIAKIPMQPPIDPDAPEPEKPDSRPKPGDVVTFQENLTDAQLAPQVVTKPAAPPKTKGGKAVAAPPAAAPGAPATAPPATLQVLTRLYVAQGVPKNGRGAAPSARIEIPLLQAPAAPRPGVGTFDETSVTVAWQPPPSNTDEAPGVMYNVYSVPAADSPPTGSSAEPAKTPAPLNDKPIAELKYAHDGAEAGKEQCFVVRSVATVGTAAIESDPSTPICITPKDTFPPAAPKGLAAVPGPGVVNLIWDANTEKDLAGYLVLRGEAPGATLQQITQEPIKETRYADRTAAPGVRYAYEVIAVDKAGNRSAPSNKMEESAR